MSTSTEHSWKLLFGFRALAAKTQVRSFQFSNKMKAGTLQCLCGFHGPERRLRINQKVELVRRAPSSF